jgi:hypothetical protein
VEQSYRSEADAERMIHTAHASCFHWLHAGSALNQQRAQCLLAKVYVRLGYSEAALRMRRDAWSSAAKQAVNRRLLTGLQLWRCCQSIRAGPSVRTRGRALAEHTGCSVIDR